MALPASRIGPLFDMQRLSSAVFLLAPTHTAGSLNVPRQSQLTDPGLILLLGWMDARDAHLARYVREYHTIYPSSSILLIKARLASLVFPSIGARDTEPAVEPIRALIKASGSREEPQVLIHALSGGGSCSLYHLYNHFSTYSRNLNRQGVETRDYTTLPKHVTLFDSIPGIWSYQFNVNVLTASAKPGWRLFLLPFAHSIAIVCWVLIRIFGVPDNQVTWSNTHNDPAQNDEVRRTYLYSPDDKLCPADSVERHAATAVMNGFDAKLVSFEKSGHVAHMRSDSGRYWTSVRETWQGTSSL
ncbi:hypothetical protein GGR51DRAFT_531049 [Nemania sp. FL0031]|nr:hypothetical protein GGR51DRAFT_531049 [Nemania sp. FL0031]